MFEFFQVMGGAVNAFCSLCSLFTCILLEHQHRLDHRPDHRPDNRPDT
jgi:hypothetical protein